jgi:hypothetical protein
MLDVVAKLLVIVLLLAWYFHDRAKTADRAVHERGSRNDRDMSRQSSAGLPT